MLSNEILKDTCSAIGVEGVERPASGLVEDRKPKFKPSSLGPRMTDEELQEMIDEADRDGDGEVQREMQLCIS